MKWYSEEETKELRVAVEKEVLNWPQVTTKKMFGCPCYLVKGKMFAGLVTKGIVITKLSTKEKAELEKIHEIKPFVAGKRIIRNWVQIILTPKQLLKVLPHVRRSYEQAMKE